MTKPYEYQNPANDIRSKLRIGMSVTFGTSGDEQTETYNKKQMKPLLGYTLEQIIVKNGIMRLVFMSKDGTKAGAVDILQDPEGNGPGYADVTHV